MEKIILKLLISITLSSCDNNTAVEPTQEALNPITETIYEENNTEIGRASCRERV